MRNTKKRMRVLVLAALGLLVFIVLPLAAQTAQADQAARAGRTDRSDRMLAGRELLDALRNGGYSIYFRHAPTDWSQNDNVDKAGDWTSCDPGRMRQLSDRGREVAVRIGRTIEELDIPVGEVLSSEYCRAVETARLMDLGEVTSTRSLMNMRVAGMVGGREEVVRRARELIGTRPAQGSNTVMVAHGNLMRAATDTYAGEAGAAVFEPEGNGRFSLVARIDPQQWRELQKLQGAGIQ